MKIRTLGQKRAKYALDKILAIKANDRQGFKSLSAAAPSMILQNGFGQTMAFLLAKGTDKHFNINETDKHIILFDIIQKWLCYENRDVKNDFIESTSLRQEFIRKLSELDQTQYLTAQKEALALLEWVKRFASAELTQGV